MVLKSPRLSIVVLNFNRLEETRHTIGHLHGLVCERDDVEVIAVDNGSTDGTAEYLEKCGDWLRPILLKSNTGIGGYNTGFMQAQGAYIMVLDDDSYPVDGKTMDRVIQRFDAWPDLGVVACCIERPDGRPVLTWHIPRGGHTGPSAAFVGCGFAIRRDIFCRIGWYPARFFLYQNEIEVAIRVKRLGFEIFYDSSCRIVHRESPKHRSGWRRVYYPTRNTIWIIRRHFPFPEAAYLIASRMAMGLFRAVQFGVLSWYLRAIRDAWIEPVEPDILPKELRKELAVFWRQNSLWHQVLRLT
ncbi:MAG: glycosyltransferase family 2 protein [Thermodesulfobacteriota bacterium]|nr:glycosyltransferase family 2 protein [Thermodesulfobacteriota bacterium]